jgi:hypothetical protein
MGDAEQAGIDGLHHAEIADLTAEINDLRSKDAVLGALIRALRMAPLHDYRLPPPTGTMVFETTTREVDPDGIGWLVATGLAAYREDGSGPQREVWDVFPLRGLTDADQLARGYQRWENADFRVVPWQVASQLDQAFRSPAKERT